LKANLSVAVTARDKPEYFLAYNRQIDKRQWPKLDNAREMTANSQQSEETLNNNRQLKFHDNAAINLKGAIFFRCFYLMYFLNKNTSQVLD